MTRVVILEAPVGDALAAAQAELEARAAEAGPGEAPGEAIDEEWQLPDGEHALGGPILLGAPGVALHLRGGDGVTLAIEGGGLTVTGADVRLTELGIVAVDAELGLAVRAPRIGLVDVDVEATGGGDVIGVDLDAGPVGAVAIDDLEIARVAGGVAAVGAVVAGGEVVAARIAVAAVEGDAATGVRLLAAGDLVASELSVGAVTAEGAARAIEVSALGELDASRLSAREVRGGAAGGVLILAAGSEAHVVDVTVDGVIAAAGAAVGLCAVAAEDLSIRGISISRIEGEGGDAIGLLAAGGGAGERSGPALEVGFGTIDGVLARGGGAAAGARVLAGATRREVVIRDLAVRRVEAPVVVPMPPPLAGPPDPAWAAWGARAVAERGEAAAPGFELPPLPEGGATVGLHAAAIVDDVAAFAEALEAGDLIVADGAVHHVHGAAIVLEAGLRAAVLRRHEVWTAVQGGWLQGDGLLVVNTTWHRLGAGVAIGPGELRIYDSIFSGIARAGEPVTLDADADWADGAAIFAAAESLRFAELGALPYVDPGPPELPVPWLAGAVAPPASADLRLVAGSPLHARAVPPPPDELERTDPPAPYVGAHPPDAAARCSLYDPLRPGDPRAREPEEPPPVADYRARDAAALHAVMEQRARVVMAPWTERGPADQTTMLLETVAERLDHLAYQQERAVAEGFLEDVRLYRSIEDHVRPLDYPIDPGLSATAMLRFTVDAAALGAVRAEGALAGDPVLEHLASDDEVDLPAGTLIANAASGEHLVVFATEERLRYVAALDRIEVVSEAAVGATSAELGATHEALAVGRWLLLCDAAPEPDGTALRGHVVRVTSVFAGTDVVEVGWDPRRPLPFPLAPGASIALGNVIPAHHGMPLAEVADPQSADPLRRDLAAALAQTVLGAVEVSLPFHPISRWAPGYPRPDQRARAGAPQLVVTVDGEAWRRVDDLATAELGEEVYALRTGADGRTAIRFGAALPDQPVALGFAPAVGLGAVGNVGAGVLTGVLHVPEAAGDPLALGRPFALDPDALRRVLRVTNPLPAVGGREPEPLDRVRYRAPRALARPLSAVRPEDYARTALALPEVAAATARAVRGPLAPVIRVTVLLAGEDTLDDAERLRRWAVVRKALEDARLLGFDVETVPPRWVPLDLDLVVDAAPHAEAGALRDAVLAALAGDGGLFDPSGPDTGKLGGDVHLADVYRAATRVPGVVSARVRRFRRLGLGMPEQLEDGVIAMGPEEVAVVRGPSRPTADGVLTVTVCGGLS